MPGLWQSLPGELEAGHPAIQSCCHSWEGGTAAKSFLIRGVTSENRKKRISDPDQKCPHRLRLCVTCVCLWARKREDKWGGPIQIMTMECGQHQIIFFHFIYCLTQSTRMILTHKTQILVAAEQKKREVSNQWIYEPSTHCRRGMLDLVQFSKYIITVQVHEHMY